MPCGKRPLIKSWDKPRNIRVITPSRYEQNEASVKLHWKKVIRDLELSYKDEQFWESHCSQVRELVGPTMFLRIAKIFHLPLEEKRYNAPSEVGSLQPSETYFKSNCNAMQRPLSYCSSPSNYENSCNVEPVHAEQSDQWSDSSQVSSEIVNLRHLHKSILISTKHLNTSKTMSFASRGSKMSTSKSFSKYSKGMIRAISTKTTWSSKLSSPEFEAAASNDDILVHPSSRCGISCSLAPAGTHPLLLVRATCRRCHGCSGSLCLACCGRPPSGTEFACPHHYRRCHDWPACSGRVPAGARPHELIGGGSTQSRHGGPRRRRASRHRNPHFDMLYCNESETDMIKWKSKYKQKTFEISASDEFSKKAEIMTKEISKEFYDWWERLGNIEFKSEIKRPEDIEELFQVWFDEHASRGLVLDPKILPCVVQSIAKYIGEPKASCPNVLKGQIAYDINAETSPAHVMAFGTGLPQKMKHIPPKNNTDAIWHSVKIPEDLRSMACVWNDVLHLTSTKAFHKWLKQYPHLPMPPCLKVLDSGCEKKQLFIVPSDFFARDRSISTSLQELALPVSQFTIELKDDISKLMNQ